MIYPMLTIAALTIRETQRRRILWIGLLMGLAFLGVFALGFHLIMQEVQRELQFETPVPGQGDAVQMVSSLLRMAGLYAINFLVVALAALVSVNTVSGEIESHTMDTMVTKPIPRSAIIMGKWLGLGVIIVVYAVAMAGAVIFIVARRSGYGVENAPAGLALMALSGLTMLTISILGGTRLSTLANGALAFMIYGIAFIGGWVEQIGAIFRNETAVDLGILSSLLMPADTLWRRAAVYFQPLVASQADFFGPFAISSQPSDAAVVYALLYIVALIALAMWSFTRREL